VLGTERNSATTDNEPPGQKNHSHERKHLRRQLPKRALQFELSNLTLLALLF